MKQKDLNNAWAWSRVEAMVDGNLSTVERKRMRRAMAEDQELQAAVEHARLVHDELRRLKPAIVPRGLSRRLLGIVDRRSPTWLWVAAPAMAAAIALLVAVPLLRTPAPIVDERAVALQEFTVAMNYVQKTAALAGVEVTGVVGDGLNDALVITRDSMVERLSQDDNGG